MKTLLKPHILILPFVLLFMVSCDLGDPEEVNDEQEKVLVEVTRLEKTTMIKEHRAVGIVRPYEEAFITAASPARIEKIMVDVGQRVKKGDLLVQMDRTQLFQAKTQMNNLKDDLQRLDTLVKVGAATKQQYDQLKTQYEVARSNVENLAENTEIRANIPGVISGRFYSEGEMFTMSPTTPEGKVAIVSLKQDQPVKIMTGVSESLYPDVKKGQQTIVRSDVYPEREFTGRVNKVYPVIDRISGTFNVEILVENRDFALRPGMYGRVTLSIGEVESILVPALAVLRQEGTGERHVFVEEDGIARRRVVTLGSRFDDKLEILSGLAEGEMLITTGQHNLMDQTEVEIVN